MRWSPGDISGDLVAGGDDPGDGVAQLRNPCCIAVCHDGFLFVSDMCNHRVLRFAMGDRCGTIVAGGRGPGSCFDQFNQPAGIALQSDGSLFVVDRLNHRVMRRGQRRGSVERAMWHIGGQT